MIFEWNEEKYHSNYMKHWIRFEHATQVWKDPMALEFYDSESSAGEDRFIKIGHSLGHGILVVVYCERMNGEVIRIISARNATKSERGLYER